jgi:hypothetical protein
MSPTCAQDVPYPSQNLEGGLFIDIFGGEE